MKAFTTSCVRWESGRVLVNALAIIFLMFASGAGVYLWRQHTVNDLHQQVSSLSAQAKQSQSSKATPSSQSPPSNTQTFTSTKGVKVIVYAPMRNQKVSSPIGVIGQIPGSWSSEAQFPVTLKDASGTTIATGTATVLGDWMTDSLVPFSVQLTYAATPAHGRAELVLQKDNPSGQASNNDQVSIPVTF